jgi:hypothetical protein
MCANPFFCVSWKFVVAALLTANHSSYKHKSKINYRDPSTAFLLFRL